MRRGDKAFADGNFSQALYEYQMRLLEKPEDARAHFMAGSCLRLLGRLDEAKQEFSLASQYGYGSEADVALGMVSMDMADFESAVAAFRKAEKKSHNNLVVINALAVALFYAGRASEAALVMKEAFGLAPDEPTIFLNMGVINDRGLNLPNKAYPYYACFAKLEPELAVEKKVVWRMARIREMGVKLSEIAEDGGECPKMSSSKVHLLSAEVVPMTKIRPTNDPRFAQVERLYHQGKFSAAAEVGAAIQSEGGVGPLGLMLIGMAFLNAQEPSKAIPRLKEATSLDPTMADAWYELGWAFEMVGDKDLATETWTEARVRFPNDPRFAIVLEGR